jgi:signal peptidase II
MREKPKSYLLPGLLMAGVVFLLDQLSKYIVLDVLQMPSRQIVEMLPFFNLVMVWNTGVSFGMLAGKGGQAALWLIIGTSLIVLMLLEWLRRAEDHKQALAIAAIIGGAVGNIVDRLRFSAVVDFLDFHLGRYHWPAFNIADSCIFLGVVVLAFGSIFTPREPDARPPAQWQDE